VSAMRRGLLCFLLVVSCLLLSAVPATPVQPVMPVPPVRAFPGLQFIVNRAGLIFSGTVISVERVRPSRPNEIETVQVRFRVEQPVRGAKVGQIISIREWGGLWVGRPRYEVGQRLMLFLYPPSKLGLTSPIPGFGNLPVDRQGWLRPSPGQQRVLDDSGMLSRVPIRSGHITARDFARMLRGSAVE